MTMADTTTPVPASGEASAPAPDWSLVPFEVGCSRCGHDLRGLTEPKCPACSLEFDWSEAVPAEQLTCARCAYRLYGLSETRCPECGTDFEWSEALASFHRSRLPYFEYRWRDQPVRSFFGTWRRVLFPSRFWRTINLHDPPRPAALFGMVGVGTLLFVIALFVGAASVDFCWSMYFWTHRGAALGLTMTFSGVAADAVRGFSGALRSYEVWTFASLFVAWILTSLASLLVFQQSMRRRKILTVQIVRVWAYAVAMIVPLLVIIGFVFASYDAFANGFPAKAGALARVGLVVFVARAVWSLRCAYRHYLGMPHALAVALSSQVVAVLGAVAVAEALLPAGVLVDVIYSMARW